jgi:hypothetical protein
MCSVINCILMHGSFYGKRYWNVLFHFGTLVSNVATCKCNVPVLVVPKLFNHDVPYETHMFLTWLLSQKLVLRHLCLVDFFLFEKQMNHMHVKTNTKFDISDAYKWILYVNPEVHQDEYKLVRNASLDNFILLQDLRHAPLGTLQKHPWLESAPCLYNTHQKIAYCGASCLQKLINIELPPEHLKKLNKLASKKQTWNQSDE